MGMEGTSAREREREQRVCVCEREHKAHTDRQMVPITLGITSVAVWWLNACYRPGRSQVSSLQHMLPSTAPHRYPSTGGSWASRMCTCVSERQHNPHRSAHRVSC